MSESTVSVDFAFGGSSGTIPSGYTEVHASDSGGGGYNIETNTRFGAGGN